MMINFGGILYHFSSGNHFKNRKTPKPLEAQGFGSFQEAWFRRLIPKGFNTAA
jgi:hypothetical protein